MFEYGSDIAVLHGALISTMKNYLSISGVDQLRKEYASSSAKMIKEEIFKELSHPKDYKVQSRMHTSLFHSVLCFEGFRNEENQLSYNESIENIFPLFSWPLYFEILRACKWKDYYLECIKDLDCHVVLSVLQASLAYQDDSTYDDCYLLLCVLEAAVNLGCLNSGIKLYKENPLQDSTSLFSFCKWEIENSQPSFFRDNGCTLQFKETLMHWRFLFNRVLKLLDSEFNRSLKCWPKPISFFNIFNAVLNCLKAICETFSRKITKLTNQRENISSLKLTAHVLEEINGEKSILLEKVNQTLNKQIVSFSSEEYGAALGHKNVGLDDFVLFFNFCKNLLSDPITCKYFLQNTKLCELSHYENKCENHKVLSDFNCTYVFWHNIDQTSDSIKELLSKISVDQGETMKTSVKMLKAVNSFLCMLKKGFLLKLQTEWEKDLSLNAKNLLQRIEKRLCGFRVALQFVATSSKALNYLGVLDCLEKNIDLLNEVSYLSPMMKIVAEGRLVNQNRLTKLFLAATSLLNSSGQEELLTQRLKQYGVSELIKTEDFVQNLIVMLNQAVETDHYSTIFGQILPLCLQCPREIVKIIITQAVENSRQIPVLIEMLEAIPAVCHYKDSVSSCECLIEILKDVIISADLSITSQEQNIITIVRTLLQVIWDQTNQVNTSVYSSMKNVKFAPLVYCLCKLLNYCILEWNGQRKELILDLLDTVLQVSRDSEFLLIKRDKTWITWNLRNFHPSVFLYFQFLASLPCTDVEIPSTMEILLVRALLGQVTVKEIALHLLDVPTRLKYPTLIGNLIKVMVHSTNREWKTLVQLLYQITERVEFPIWLSKGANFHSKVLHILVDGLLLIRSMKDDNLLWSFLIGCLGNALKDIQDKIASMEVVCELCRLARDVPADFEPQIVPCLLNALKFPNCQVPVDLVVSVIRTVPWSENVDSFLLKVEFIHKKN
ncbi:uncharacterized protein LOC143256306 isoform X2 [Tachypleus tridentatus]|uniref:uncharacterized protein LOC143256306 isoform X2 n=1 Tax=Tachypleus tridentatus TaxID=6853 RepID=UPI003FD1C49E